MNYIYKFRNSGNYKHVTPPLLFLGFVYSTKLLESEHFNQTAFNQPNNSFGYLMSNYYFYYIFFL